MARCAFFVAVLFFLSLLLPGCDPPTPPGPSAAAEKRLLEMLTYGRIIADPSLPYTIHVKDVSGRSLTEVVLKQKNSRGVIETVVHATEGELSVDAENKRILLRLHKGATLAKNGTRSTFQDEVFDLPLSERFLK